MYFLVLAGILLAYMTGWFVVSLIKRRNDVADVAWGLGFVLLAWISFFIGEGEGMRGILVGGLVTIWGTRLAVHIYKRNKGKTEDYRYLAWRKEWGKWFYPRSYAQVYLLQGVLLYLIVFPVLFINKNTVGGLGALDFVGLAVWILGFYFESKGDAELANFIKNPENKGKLLRTGLWQYTRHPNYFGEVTQWWGVWLISMSLPGAWVAIVGPLTITILILKVSGIPLLEKRMEENPDFADYKRVTNKFIPWFRKS